MFNHRKKGLCELELYIPPIGNRGSLNGKEINKDHAYKETRESRGRQNGSGRNIIASSNKDVWKNKFLWNGNQICD
jgi:hypothetical protein